jgi:hypothetical protein
MAQSETEWWQNRDEMLLLRYSEWLDSSGLVAGNDDADARNHTDLVNEFMAS